MVAKEQLLERIIVDPKIMVGKPIIKGTRVTVQHIIGLLAQGWTNQEVIAEYKNITDMDIRACLAFASQTLDNTTFMPVMSPV